MPFFKMGLYSCGRNIEFLLSLSWGDEEKTLNWNFLIDRAPQQWGRIGSLGSHNWMLIEVGWTSLRMYLFSVSKLLTYNVILHRPLRHLKHQASLQKKKGGDNTLKRRLNFSCDCVQEFKRLIHPLKDYLLSTTCQKLSRYQKYRSEQNTILYALSLHSSVGGKDNKHRYVNT